LPASCGLFLEPDGALDDIERAPLCFGIDAPDIESDDARHQHVGAAERGDDHDPSPA
jgi:hypothetical protein